MSYPNNKLAQLAEKLRSRLHGHVEDFKPEYIPSDKSSEARVMFDRYIQNNLAKHGEKEVEQILQQFEKKARDIEREAELRIWEMIFGTEDTFKERAAKWTESDIKICERAKLVGEIYKKEEETRNAE